MVLRLSVMLHGGVGLQELVAALSKEAEELQVKKERASKQVRPHP